MSHEQPTLSIIVPVFNEERQVAAVIDRLFDTKLPVSVEWIFVDDASTDGTLKIVEEKKNQHGFALQKLEKNRGKGAAVREGIRRAKGKFILFQDADFEYDPDDIPKLLESALSGKADVVYGSRFKKNAIQVHRTYHYLVNRFLTMLSNLMSGIYLTDMETCYKLIRSDLLKAMNLKSNRFGLEVEVTAYLGLVRPKICEVPISYYPRTHLQGKKINWKDGVAALFHLVRFNWLTSKKAAFQNLPARFND